MTDVARTTARWVLGGRHGVRLYGWSQCRYCGRAQDRDCQAVDCMACGSRQCHGNGSGDGRCAICHHGYLPGWSRSVDAKTCGYRGCMDPAVAQAPRVARVCRAHLERCKVRVSGNWLTLAAYIDQRIAHRDSSRDWECWRWVD